MSASSRSTVSRLRVLAAGVLLCAGPLGCSGPADPGAEQRPPATPTTPVSLNPWATGDLTAAASAPPAAQGPLAGYVFEASQSQHIFYVAASDKHIREIWWDVDGWHTGDVTVAAGAVEAEADSLAAFVSPASNTQHVVYVGSNDAHVHELWWNPDGWHSEDLSEIAGAPDAGPTITGYSIDAQQSHHIFYVRKPDHHVQELWWDSTQWRTQDLSAQTLAPAALDGSVVGYLDAAQGIQHVIYAGADSHLYELWCDSAGWHMTDLTAVTGAPGPLAATVTGYMFDAQGTQHVFYVGVDNKVYEVWSDPAGWHSSDLTTMTGAPPPSANPMAAYAFEAQGTQHVVYRAVDGQLHELWWDDKGWHVGDLTGGVSAPKAGRGRPLAYAFEAQGTQHVLYVTGGDGRVFELWSGNPQG